jgi:hypothetical protein
LNSSNVCALDKALSPLAVHLQFTCFSGVVTQLYYTELDADTLFHVNVPDGAVKCDTQSTSMFDNNSTVPSG